MENAEGTEAAAPEADGAEAAEGHGIAGLVGCWGLQPKEVLSGCFLGLPHRKQEVPKLQSASSGGELGLAEDWRRRKKAPKKRLMNLKETQLAAKPCSEFRDWIVHAQPPALLAGVEATWQIPFLCSRRPLPSRTQESAPDPVPERPPFAQFIPISLEASCEEAWHPLGTGLSVRFRESEPQG